MLADDLVIFNQLMSKRTHASVSFCFPLSFKLYPHEERKREIQNTHTQLQKLSPTNIYKQKQNNMLILFLAPNPQNRTRFHAFFCFFFFGASAISVVWPAICLTPWPAGRHEGQ